MTGLRRHELRKLLAQRIFSMACGWEDANDAARLAGDFGLVRVHPGGLDALPARQAQLTFAMARHALADVTQIFAQEDRLLSGQVLDFGRAIL